MDNQMKLFKLALIIFMLSLFSCASGGGDSSSSEKLPPEDPPIVSEPIDTTVYHVKVTPQKGRCLEDGEVIVKPLFDGTFMQTGLTYTGYLDDLGKSNVPAEISEIRSEIFFEGECDDEVNGGTGNQKLSGIVNNAEENYVNPLTKIRSIVARDDDTSTDIDIKLANAQVKVLNFLNFQLDVVDFTKMNIAGDTTSDAAILLANSMFLYGRTDEESGAYMVEVANGIINNDLGLRAEVIETYGQLPILNIINNIKASYGVDTPIPPIWRFAASELTDYFENEHVVQGQFNIGDTYGCNCDLPYGRYAIPHIFESWIETSKYFAINQDANISIWNHWFASYDRPGTKILDVERMDGINLEGPAYLSFAGKLGDHGLVAGEKYYIVIEKDGPFVLSTGCGGGLLPFGRKLASNDGGQTWIGPWINNSWWRSSGLVMFGSN